MKVHLGFDDTDTREYGCTTYLASEAIKILLSKGVVFFDYPNLIRLNPNVPWKTRGNGAVALRFETDVPERMFKEVCRLVSRMSGEGANPAVVMLIKDVVPEDIREFSERALFTIVGIKNAYRLIKKYGIRYYVRGSSMGLVGSLAAVGMTLDRDYTYEVLAYRARENWGTKRRLDVSSVIKMSHETYPYTFNNYDQESGRILITPRGPDPVLFGIRGEAPEYLMKAIQMIKVEEPIDRYVIFRTNQGTGLHLVHPLRFPLKAYECGYVKGRVSKKPWVERGGHVFFKVGVNDEEAICAVYEPTGSFRKLALGLICGDRVEVGGGVRKRTIKHPPVINVEYIRVLSLAKDLRYVNPSCPICSRRMDSEGSKKGYRCLYCGYRDRSATKVAIESSRTLKEGLYIPPSRAHRHLTKPLQRYGMEKNRWDGRILDGWCWYSRP